jgi:formate-dependent phosphoribosylglycinamide formyltransferase (GAR transformylase)
MNSLKIFLNNNEVYLSNVHKDQMCLVTIESKSISNGKIIAEPIIGLKANNLIMPSQEVQAKEILDEIKKSNPQPMEKSLKVGDLITILFEQE